MKKWIIISIHFLFWTGWIFYFTFVRANVPSNLEFLYVGLFIIRISVFYVNLFVLLPVFFKPKKFRVLLPIWIALIFLYTGVIYAYNFILAGLFPHDYNLIYNGFRATLHSNIFIILLLLIGSTVYKLAEKWFHHERERNRLEKENLKSELSFLRIQINPHFLYNTLNNIYTLAYQKSDRAPEAIAKLSKIMRYMLDENAKQEVPLEKEVKYLKQFMDLQALRVKNGLQLKLDISGNIETVNIAPFILINFVDNVFKHGILDDADNPIIIKIQAYKNKIIFFVSNKIDDGMENYKKGIGLENVIKRLRLIYKSHYHLSINNKNGIYAVKLRLTTKY